LDQMKRWGVSMNLVPKNRGDGPDEAARRKRLLALIHIAVADLGWSDGEYRDMLTAAFNVPTASALTNEELSRVVTSFMVNYHWRPKGYKSAQAGNHQLEALKHRALGFASQINGGEQRVKGLCRKMCGVDRIEWCSDVASLKRLLAAMGNIKRREKIGS